MILFDFCRKQALPGIKHVKVRKGQKNFSLAKPKKMKGTEGKMNIFKAAYSKFVAFFVDHDAGRACFAGRDFPS